MAFQLCDFLIDSQQNIINMSGKVFHRRVQFNNDLNTGFPLYDDTKYVGMCHRVK